MGQRLNIEIKKNNKVIANCYYHWSAYTSSALRLTKDIIKEYKQVKEDEDILYAIRLLGLTGAGISREDISYLYRTYINFDIAEEGTNGMYKWPIATSRDNGLIGILEDEIKETRSWAEGTVVIDLDNKTFSWDVFFWHDEKEAEEYKNDNYIIEDISSWFTYKDIPFSRITSYAKKLSKLFNRKDYYLYKVADNKYISIIE